MSVRGLVCAVTLCLAASALGACGQSTPPGAGAVERYAGTNLQNDGYLYVAGFTVPSREEFIDRFRLVHGIPQKHLDATYEHYGGLVALGGDGTLYAFGPLGEIVAFAPGSKTPSREIYVGGRCGSSSYSVFNALAADRSGYLFVLIYTYPELRVRHPRVDRSRRTPCNGVAIYAPNAQGNAKPIQTIHVKSAAELDGLAVDADDNLYLAGNYPSRIKEYADAIEHPRLVRTVSGKYVGTVRSIATDGAGNLYVANAMNSYTSGWIDRYPPNATAPVSRIVLGGSGEHLLYSIAVVGRYLYADDTAKSVDVYRARKNGQQSPLESIPLSHVVSVAAGR